MSIRHTHVTHVIPALLRGTASSQRTSDVFGSMQEHGETANEKRNVIATNTLARRRNI